MDVRKAALKALIKILEKKCQVDEIINKYSAKVLVPTELHLLTSGVIKHKLTLDYYIGILSSRKIKDLSYQVLNVLRLAIYELEFLQNPDYAVINSYVEIIKEFDKKLGGFVNAILRNYLRKKDQIQFPSLETYPVEHISIKYSHPEFMVKKWIMHYGIEDTINICKYNNLPPKLVLRVNTLKKSKKDLLNLFKEHGISSFSSSLMNECLIVNFQGGIKSIPGFREGYWVVQSESSSLVSQVLSPQQEDVILDLCAAPGSKSTHIAALTKDKARIKAIDINSKRIERIKDNCLRLGINSIKIETANATKFRSDIMFDKILVDAPCSNTGVLIKKVDARWNKSEKDIKSLAELQLEILNNAANLLKSGGIMVYSTCSIEPEENQQVIGKFLEVNKDFYLDKISPYLPWKIQEDEGYYQILQSKHHIDGFFIARLKKHL